MNIILDANECPGVSHPEPYAGVKASIQEIQEFIQRTIKSNKQPIVIFGANWCPDARLLEDVIQLPTVKNFLGKNANILNICLLYTSPSPRDVEESRMPSSA